MHHRHISRSFLCRMPILCALHPVIRNSNGRSAENINDFHKYAITFQNKYIDQSMRSGSTLLLWHLAHLHLHFHSRTRNEIIVLVCGCTLCKSESMNNANLCLDEFRIAALGRKTVSSREMMDFIEMISVCGRRQLKYSVPLELLKEMKYERLIMQQCCSFVDHNNVAHLLIAFAN